VLWVERALGRGSRVVASRRMTGGVTSAVHRLTVERGGTRAFVVLRQYEHALPHFADLVEREVAILRGVNAAGLPAPSLLAFSAGSGEAGGRPSVLMSRLGGHLYLTPADPGEWLGQMAAMVARIHSAPVAAPDYEPWIDPAKLAAPGSATRPDVWRAAIKVLQSPPPGQRSACFIHRDFQHFNLLWARGRLTGVVDWSVASSGPPEVDVGHCRLNLAVLFSPEWAERFRLAYEAETGRRTDPWRDLLALAVYGDAWRRFIPIQAGGRVPVDAVGMTARVEDLIESVLGRF
jgi:aminoglycoside phosphotransferase (APT) family kinase protein